METRGIKESCRGDGAPHVKLGFFLRKAGVLYDALARLIGLIEVRPNQWVNEHGEYYTLTKYGFKRYGVGLQS